MQQHCFPSHPPTMSSGLVFPRKGILHGGYTSRRCAGSAILSSRLVNFTHRASQCIRKYVGSPRFHRPTIPSAYKGTSTNVLHSIQCVDMHVKLEVSGPCSDPAPYKVLKVDRSNKFRLQLVDWWRRRPLYIMTGCFTVLVSVWRRRLGWRASWFAGDDATA